MSSPLLAAKLSIPAVAPGLVRRPQLLQRLKQSRARKLTLVSAPAGYGKTTLLSQWAAVAREEKLPVAWISLSRHDNDPASFSKYLLAALSNLNLELCDIALSSTTSQPLSLDWLSELVQEIASLSPADFILVLDNYHLITDQPVHEAVAFLIDHMPPQMHLVIASRAEPPFLLAQLRSRGQLLELRIIDLQFNLEETTTFLNQTMKLGLDPEQIAGLAERTTGWVTGLSIAAAALAEHSNRAAFLAEFTGTYHHIADYLAEQVFARQSLPVQTFLLHTCILDRLTGPLCDALTKREDGQAMLEQLERTNVFLTPLDKTRDEYSYHPLFAGFLKQHLYKSHPNLAKDLHCRAALWFEQNNRLEEAIPHFLDARDYPQAINLIQSAAEAIWNRDEMLTILGWMKALPDHLIRSNPAICLHYAAVLAATGHLDNVEPYLQSVERFYSKFAANNAHNTPALHSLAAQFAPTDTKDPNEEIQTTLGIIDYIRASITLFDDVPGAIALCQRALQRIPINKPRQRGRALLYLGHAYLLEGSSIESTARTLVKAGLEARVSGYISTYLITNFYLAQLRVLQGRLLVAFAIYQKSAEIVAEQDRPPSLGIEQTGMGDLLREWNDLGPSARFINEGMRLAEAGGDFIFMQEAYLARARLEQALGNVDTALAFARKAMRAVHPTHIAATREIEAYAARLQIAQGNLPAAEHWAHTSGLSADDAASVPTEYRHMVLARVLMAQDNPDQAAALLARVLASAQAARRQGRVLEILVLQALALQAAGDATGAFRALREAMVRGEREGYIRVFLDEGAPMLAMLGYISRERDGAANYARRLIAIHDKTGIKNSTSAVRPVPMLSERELEVLRLIARGKSYQHIAEELVVAPSTVQSHIKNIYQKLDAHSGREAVSRAQELNLLL